MDSHMRTSKQCSHCSRKKTDFGGLHSHWSTARHLARSCTSASHYAQELTLASGFPRTFEPSCLPKSLARGHPTLGGRSPWNTNFQNLHLQRSRPAIISSHSHLPIYICTVATLHCWWFEDSEASIFSIGSRLNLGTCDSSRGQRVSESFGRCGLIEVTRTMPGRGSWCKRGFFQGAASTGLGVQSGVEAPLGCNGSALDPMLRSKNSQQSFSTIITETRASLPESTALTAKTTTFLEPCPHAFIL